MRYRIDESSGGRSTPYPIPTPVSLGSDGLPPERCRLGSDASQLVLRNEDDGKRPILAAH